MADVMGKWGCGSGDNLRTSGEDFIAGSKWFVCNRYIDKMKCLTQNMYVCVLHWTGCVSCNFESAFLLMLCDSSAVWTL